MFLDECKSIMFKHTDTLSKPTIVSVKTELMSVILTVQLYSSHPPPLNITVFVTNQTGFVNTFVWSALSPNFMNYTVELSLSPGVYRFTVRASNSFRSSEESEVYPPVGMDGIEGLKENFCELL